MKKTKGTENYLHGFSKQEQERLIRQAQFLEQEIYRDVDFSECQNVLEIGCGVGAQSEILLRRFPNLKIMGIELADTQIATLKARLASSAVSKERFEFKKMDAKKMSFPNKTFDGAFLCWVLEHIPGPDSVLAEAKRVLKKGASIYVTEVMNSSFFLDPYSPHTWKYWMEFNDFQYTSAGDPFIGAKLGNLLLAQGFSDIQTNVISWHFDNRRPEKRRKVLNYWTELLLSAAPALIKAGRVKEETVKGMKRELKDVAKDPNAVFFYSFVQARALA